MSDISENNNTENTEPQTSVKLPELDVIDAALKKEMYKHTYSRVLKSTIYSLIVVAACAILVAVYLMPVLRIYGTSMTPTVSEGDIVVALKGSKFDRGDIVALYYSNKLLVKRVIGKPGEWIDIDKDGNVFINGEYLDEPYLVEKAFGECTIELPYQVPDGRYFVMGDHRATSSDSRSIMVGAVDIEQIVGRIVFRVWPFARIGSAG